MTKFLISSYKNHLKKPILKNICLVYGPFLLLLIYLFFLGKEALKVCHQTDFIAYYYGVKAAFSGLNPYQASQLSMLTGTALQAHVHFAYPPYMLFLFKPLTFFSFEVARNIFLLSKMLIIIFMFWLFYRYLLPNKKYALLMTLLACGAYHCTLAINVLSGNVAVLELLLLWLGFLFFMRNQPLLAAIFIALGACFKLTPIFFLIVLLSKSEKKYWRAFAAGLGVFGGINLMSFLLQTELFKIFLQNTNTLDSSGFCNPSSLCFIKFELSPWLQQFWAFPNISYVIYGLFVGILMVMTGFLLYRRPNLQQNSAYLLTLSLFFYALAMPRFKDYSFLILLLPALWLISILPKLWQKFLVTILLSVSLFPYYHLCTIGGLYLYTVYISWNADKTTLQHFSSLKGHS